MATLWIPILLSAVIVFFASSLVHMVLPWHKQDFRKLPDEDKILAALGPYPIPPGDYLVPRGDTRAEMQTPEFAEKMRRGPVMVATVMPPGPFRMGRSLGLWFAYLVVVSAITGCAGLHTLPAAAGYRTVFRLTLVVSFLAYTGALWQNVIWYQSSWRTALKSTIDGLIYAALTAGTFGWLWPR